MILHSLAFDIVGDGILIAMFSNSSSKVAVRPEFASPQLLFHFRTTPEYLSCGKAFYDRYDLGYAIGWNRLDQEMYMILICANLQEFQLVSLLYIQADFLHNIVYMIIKYCTPIFGRKYQMVYQYRYVMTLVYVFTHIATLRRKRRGIQPQGIQSYPQSSRKVTPTF
jgi:hypothetical protein